MIKLVRPILMNALMEMMNLSIVLEFQRIKRKIVFIFLLIKKKQRIIITKIALKIMGFMKIFPNQIL